MNCGYALSNKHHLDRHIQYSGSPQRSDTFNLDFVNFLPLSRKGTILISVLWILNMLQSRKKPQPTQRWISYIFLKIWTVNNSTEGKIKLFRTKYSDTNMIFSNFYKNSNWLCCQLEYPFGLLDCDDPLSVEYPCNLSKVLQLLGYVLTLFAVQIGHNTVLHNFCKDFS